MYIIKVGGGGNINLEGVASDLAVLEEPFLVVLGANALRDQLGQRLGQEKVQLTSVSGYSSLFSDADAVDLIMMAYSGLSNRRFVEMCQKAGVNAVGLTGLDGRLIQGRRNRGIKVRENGKTMIKRDFSGKPVEVNVDKGYRPVLSIPIIDEAGFAINSENDDIVAVLQGALNADKVIQLIEAPGFLEDKDDEASVLKALPASELKEREVSVEGRMKRKMLALGRLFDAGAAEVIIADGRVAHPVHDALAGKGTSIK